MAAVDPDMDVGGRVFLIDGFSAVAARVGRSVTTLRGGFVRGVSAINTASRSLTDGLRRMADGSRGMEPAFRRGAADLRTFAGVLGGGLATGFRAAQTGAGSFASSLRRADSFVARFQRTVRSATAPLRRFGSELSAAFGGIGRYFSLGGVVQGLAGLLQASVRAGSEMANLRIAFTTMMGSAGAAEEHLRALQRFGATTPFEFADLAVHSRNLQAFGFQVSEVIPLLREFGDAAFVTNTGNAGVAALARVFGNVRQTGRITFGQLNQLAARGIPAHQILREQLNLTGLQLRNIARSGIPAERIMAALRTGMRQRFAGGMERALDTIAARVSNLNDLWGMFLVQVGDRLQPVVIAFLRQFARVLDTIDMDRLATRVSHVLSVATIVGRGVVGVLSLLGGAVSDTAERWNAGTGRMERRWIESFANIRDVMDGVVAMLSSSNSRGVARIPQGLHDALVRRGLWPLTLKIAQWGDRVRQIVGGFLEGFGTQLRASGQQLRGIAEGLGLVQPGMVMNRAEARQLGQDLARLVRGYMALRVAMIGLGAATTVVSAAMTFGRAVGAIGRGLLWAGGAVVRFVRWLPVAAAWTGRVTSFLRALGTVASRVIGNPFAGLARGGPILALLAAQILGAIALWRNWNAIQGQGARATGIRALASLLLGPWYALVHVVKEGPRQVAALGRGVVGVARAVGPVVGRALAAVGRFLWAGLVTAFTPVGRFFRVIGAFLVVALYVALASLWVRVRGPVTAFTAGVRGLVVRAGRAAMGVFDAVGRGAGAVAGRVREVVAAAGGAVAGFMLGVAVRVVGFGARVVGVARRVRSAVAGIFGGLAAGAFVWIAPLLARVAMVAVRMRVLLGSAFAWVAATAQMAFARLAEIILSPLRSIAARLIALFRALPRGMQPASLQGMVGDLEAFSRSSGGPVGGEPPAPTPAPSPAAPGPPPVQVSQRQQVAGQAASRAALPPAPVTVNVPQPVVQQVRVIVDGRELAASVERRQEGERLRQGR